MAGNGPAPKAGATRRRRTPPKKGARTLPAEGRIGPTPPWPLDNEGTDFVFGSEAEVAVWEGLWRLPQAVEWERMNYTRVVARYVRTLVAAELPGASSQLLAEVRQMEDRLGLTPRSMQTLGWETDEKVDEEDELEPEVEPEAIPPRAYVPKKEA